MLLLNDNKIISKSKVNFIISFICNICNICNVLRIKKLN